MNFIKRAKTSILRSPGKSMILLILVFVLGTIIAGALAVEGAVVSTEENLRRNMPSVVSVGIDEQQVIEYHFANGEFPDVTGLTADLVRSIGELPYVQDFNYSIESMLASFEVDQYLPTMEGIFPGWNDQPAHFPSFFDITGLSGTNLIPLSEGVIELVDGRMLSESEIKNADTSAIIPAFVSNAFAEQNNLSIGCVFTLSNKIPQGIASDLPDNEVWLEENLFAYASYEFEIVGLFDMVDRQVIEAHDIDTYFLHQNMLNQIYVPNWFAEAVEQFRALARQDREGEIATENFEPSITSIFILEDPREIEDFRQTVEPMLPDFVAIDDLTNTFAAISTSMTTLLEIADWILWVAIGATFLIVSLLLTLFLRDRRYEMGIYLALGEKKGKIISQVLLEVLALSIVGISIAVFAGTAISSNLSRMMLQNAMIEQMNPVAAGDGTDSGMFFAISGSTSLDALGFGGETLTVEEMIAAFDLSLNGETILLFYIVGLSVVVVATLIPIAYITKLNPKKILMRT